MKLAALFGSPPRIIEIEISKEAEAELEQLKKELNLSSLADRISCTKPLDEFLALERETLGAR